MYKLTLALKSGIKLKSDFSFIPDFSANVNHLINTYENDNVNKTLFKLLGISKIKKDGVVKVFMT